jgi:hypothetical protein
MVMDEVAAGFDVKNMKQGVRWRLKQDQLHLIGCQGLL